VLTMSPRAHPETGNELLKEVPKNIIVTHAFALDTARHFSINNRYPNFLAWPDRWISWWLGGVPAGLSLIMRLRPKVIWSTYPIATAHLIGLTLHRLSGIPWVADFRDSMTEPDYPRDAKTRKIYRWIERNTIKSATGIVFTTPGTLRMYAKRYPDIPEKRWVQISNGYDENNFGVAEARLANKVKHSKKVKLVHSGILYPSERDPINFFSALAALKSSGEVSATNLKVIFRASGYDDHFRSLINNAGLGDIVFLCPAIAYYDALTEMLEADGLLLFQASNCNHQVPAKLYEYMRARRPILALTDSSGDTAQLMLKVGIDTIASLQSSENIKCEFKRFLMLIREGNAPIAREDLVSSYSRHSQTIKLARLFDTLI
jgi:hypothetical protein